MRLVAEELSVGKVKFAGKINGVPFVDEVSFPLWSPFQKKNKMRVERKRLNKFEAYGMQRHISLV